MADEERPATVQDLVRHLASTLVQKEVMEPMDSIQWGQGTPPPPARADNPPAAEGAPAPVAQPAPGTTPATPAAPAAGQANVPAPTAAEIDWEALKDPTTGLYAGKYPSKQEAVKGMGNVVNMAKEALNREAAAIQENARLQKELEATRHTQPAATPAAASLNAPPTTSRVEVEKASANLDAVLASVVEQGGLLDEESAKRLKDSLREVVTVSARQAAEESLTIRDGRQAEENKKWNDVDAFMKEKHPDSLNFADEIGLYVQTNPLIQSAVTALTSQGKEKEATELAWTAYQKDMGLASTRATLDAAQHTEVVGEAKDQVRREAVDEARKQAGIMGGGNTGVHENTGTPSSREEIDAAAAAMRAYGVQPGSPAAARWRQLVILKDIDPKVFNGQ